MIKDYDNNKKMAELGRQKAKQDAVRGAKAAIRNNAVRLLNLDDVGEVSELVTKLKSQLDELLEIMKMDHYH